MSAVDRPILFSAPMVRALLAGTKTQTRRAIKAPASVIGFRHFDADRWDRLIAGNVRGDEMRCPYGQPGDRLWVRETWAQNWNQLSETSMDRSHVYRADGETRAQDNGTDLPWRPSIHMPRWASRITLEVTGVRVERLQDISQDDARAEGAPPSHPTIDRISREFGYADFPRSWYAQLWESINGPGSWGANPWVWVVEFRQAKPVSVSA